MLAEQQDTNETLRELMTVGMSGGTR
jgi:uncharacterized protein YoaH (UPF0181 family)